MPDRSLEELESMVGWQSPSFSVTLEAGRVADFAEAVFDSDPVFTDPVEARSRGLSDPPLPVTFFASLFHIDKEIHEPDLGFDLDNTLHGEQSFSFDRTPKVGETLYTRTEFTDVYEKYREDGGTITFAELEWEYRDEVGDLVLTTTKTRLEVSEA